MPVKIYNRQRTVQFPRGAWDRQFQDALAAAGHADDYVEVTLLSNRAIAELNQEWRGKTGPTDCLSFPASPDLPPMPGMKGRYLGDIVISVEQARIQGAVHLDADIAPADAIHAEVLFLFIHSLLHLLGHDHETSPHDEEIMIREQNRIFTLVGEYLYRC